MLLTSKSLANKLVFKAFLNDFDEAELYCNGSSILNENSEIRIKSLDGVVTFDDGTIWYIYSDGSIQVSPGSSGGGCYDGTSGSITWTNGNTYYFPSSNNTYSNQNNNYNWNPNENTPGCSWCTNSGGGGGLNNSIPNCQNSTFWENYPLIVKKEYTQNISKMINDLGVNTCSQFNSIGGCVENSAILCSGVENNCIQIINGHLDINGFIDCMGAVLQRLPCENKAKNFIETYGLDMSVVEIEQLIGGFGNSCSSQEVFDEYVSEQLIYYFQQFKEDPPNVSWNAPTGVSELCWQSLSLTKIGDGYYVKIAPFYAQFQHFSTGNIIDLSYPSLCLQVTGKDFFTGNILSDTEIKKEISNAIESARRAIYQELNRGVVPKQQAIVRGQFKVSLLFNLKLGFSGLPSINTDANGCNGVPTSLTLWNCN
jgi:hypothetical protein